MAILDGPAGRWGPLATGAHGPLEQEIRGLALQLQRQLKMQVREGDGSGRAEEEAGETEGLSFQSSRTLISLKG